MNRERTSTCPGWNCAGSGRSTRARPISACQVTSPPRRCRGITGVGSGVSRQDPQQALLSEVVARINALFGSEFADPQIEGFVIAAAGMAEEDPRIADQIDHNAVDQFLASPDLRETLTDAAVLNEGAFGKLTGALTGESERADELIRLIGGYLYQARRLRMTDETPIEDTDKAALAGDVLAVEGGRSPKEKRLLARLELLERLDDGWWEAGSQKPQAGVLAVARLICKQVGDLEPVPTLTARTDGTVAFEVSVNTRHCVAVIEAEGTQMYLMADDGSDADPDELEAPFDADRLTHFLVTGSPQ